jgi:hypothetical protein
MKLADAYEHVRLRPLVPFERDEDTIIRRSVQGFESRCIGSTTHMLIELYLDLADAFREVALWDRHRIRFLVVCLSCYQGRQLRKLLEQIHRVLDQDVILDRVNFFPEASDARWLSGSEWYSWGVFCDHAVKEKHDLKRSTGPYRLVRSLERELSTWTARDRDGGLVCHLTDDGMRELVDASPCPITYCPDPQVLPVTYPAWSGFRNQVNLRLTKAFQL